MALKSGKKEEKDESAQHRFEEDKLLNLPQLGIVLAWKDQLGEYDVYV